MAGLSLQTDAVVIDKRPASDSFQTFRVLSPEHGLLMVLQRLSSKKSAAFVSLDLFDTASLLLESSNQGQTWFVKESRILTRRTAIGRHYESLLCASQLCSLAMHNPVHGESWSPMAFLLTSAFDAFESSRSPEVILLKALYRFARDEGYPVKQEWLPMLRDGDAELAESLLSRPASDYAGTGEEVTRLLRSLKDYLRGQTELRID